MKSETAQILEVVTEFRKEHREDMSELRRRLDKTDSDVAQLETELAVLRAELPRSTPWKLIGMMAIALVVAVLALAGLPPDELAKLVRLMPW